MELDRDDIAPNRFKFENGAAFLAGLQFKIVILQDLQNELYLQKLSDRPPNYICLACGTNCHQDLIQTTGKPFSEALVLASTNPQYDKRLSIELPVQNMKIPSVEHEENMRTCCVQKLFFVMTFRTTYVHNMFYPCSPSFLSMF